jgi:methanogenic corrinoid protein MtbC1
MMNGQAGEQGLEAFQQRAKGHDGVQTALDRLFRQIGQTTEPAQISPAKPKRADLIEKTLEKLVIPKLLVTHSQDPDIQAGTPRAPIVSVESAQSFTRLILANDMQSGMDLIEKLSAKGHSLAHICIDLLTPAARDLGIMWEEDQVSFIDVTTGLGLLHILLHRAAEICRAPVSLFDPSRRVILASLSGEQHNFGLQMVAELFRQSGWDVTAEPSITESNLVQLVKDHSFAIAGLSIADNTQSDRLALAIRAVRKASANDKIGVIVGGPVFVAQPELAPLIGADLTASDAEQAVFRAEGLRVLMAAWT